MPRYGGNALRRQAKAIRAAAYNPSSASYSDPGTESEASALDAAANDLDADSEPVCGAPSLFQGLGAALAPTLPAARRNGLLRLWLAATEAAQALEGITRHARISLGFDFTPDDLATLREIYEGGGATVAAGTYLYPADAQNPAPRIIQWLSVDYGSSVRVEAQGSRAATAEEVEAHHD